MSGLKVVRVPAPAGGIDVTSGPEYVPQTKGAILSNLLPGRPGKVQVRGNLTIQPLGSDQSTTGLWRNGKTVLAGRASSTYSWNAETLTPPVEVEDVLIGRSYIGYGEYVYGISGTFGDTLLRWSSADIIDAIANSPVDARAVTIHLDRLFVLGGSKPGTSSPVTTRSVWWTDPLAGETLPATLDAWKDDASGLVNEIQLDGTESDPGVGFARINGSLAILRERSIHMLTGQTPENFAVRKVLAARGCTSASAIAEYNGGCYYMAQDGLAWFDGNDSTVVSEAVNGNMVALNRDLSTAVVEALPRDFLYVSVASGPGVGAGLDQFLFHIPTGSWSSVRYTGTNAAMQLASWDGEAPGPVFLGWRSLSAGNVSVPESTVPAVDTVVPGEPLAIDIQLYSRWVPLAMPGEKSQLHRIIPSFSWESVGETGMSPLQLAVYGPDDQLILPFTTLPAPDDGNTFRRRPVIECFAEADDIRLAWRIDPDWDNPLYALEIYDTVIEYQEARQRQP